MKLSKCIAIAALVALPVTGPRAEGPTHPQGVNWFGKGLETKQNYFSLKNKPPKAKDVLDGTVNTSKVTLRVDEDCIKVGKPGIPAYKCRVSADRAICKDNPGYVVLVGGYWTSSTEFVPSRESFTAGCSVDDITNDSKWSEEWTGALAKCVELWHMNSQGKTLTACIHMARAAYTALTDETSHTCPGTPVDAWDVVASGPHLHDPGCTMIKNDEPRYGGKKDLICKMWFEASWDENGAICINHVRYTELPPGKNGQDIFKVPIQDASGNTLFDCRPRVDKAGMPISGASPITSNLGALVVNRSELNLYTVMLASSGPPKGPDCSSKKGAAGQPWSIPRKSWDKPADCLKLCPKK